MIRRAAVGTATDGRVPGNQVMTYSYDPASNLSTATYPNGVQSSMTYDALNRITGLATQSTGHVYQRGPTGNLTGATESTGRTLNWSYDGIYRLTNETIASDPDQNNGSASYTLDPVGNRLTESTNLPGLSSGTFGYNANDEVNTETYDANGNTLTTGGKGFAYDAENHLTSMNSGTVTIVYDGDGNRVAKTVGGVTTQYLVDDMNPIGYAQVVEELVNGAAQRTYTYGLQRISENQVIDGVSTPSFYEYDGEGDVRLLTNIAGQVTDTYEYDAFGNEINHTGSTPNNYLYRGEQWDPDLSLYYLRARYYNPVTGRFLSQDPYAGSKYDPPTLHRYRYARGNPTNYIDPSGRADASEYAGNAVSFVKNRVVPVAAFGADVVCLYYAETSAVHLVNQWVSLSKFDRAIDVGVLALQLPACAATAEFGLDGIFSAELEPVELLEEGEAAEDPTFCCFAAGTPVHTDHGNVPVEKISVGDKVYSRNRTTGTTELRSVTALTPQHRDKLVELRIEGERAALRPSLDHPFWAKKDLSDPGHWITAANLVAGELLETLDGKWRKIELDKPVDGQETVYNFTVDNDHDYFVGETGFLVHNAEGCGCQFALGKREGLRNWANKLGLDHFLGPANWKQLFLEQVANPQAEFNVNMSGFPGIGQGASVQQAVEAEIDGQLNTGWELQQLRDAGRLPEAKFYMPGELEPTCNPFE